VLVKVAKIRGREMSLVGGDVVERDSESRMIALIREEGRNSSC
jgi:hypothetical protein